MGFSFLNGFVPTILSTSVNFINQFSENKVLYNKTFVRTKGKASSVSVRFRTNMSCFSTARRLENIKIKKVICYLNNGSKKMLEILMAVMVIVYDSYASKHPVNLCVLWRHVCFWVSIFLFTLNIHQAVSDPFRVRITLSFSHKLNQSIFRN